MATLAVDDVISVVPSGVLQPGCPFLTRLSLAGPSVYPHGVVCGAPSQLHRPPSADELAWLCTKGHFRACPAYRAERNGGEP